jgi:ammonium transporter, Amt family
VRTLPARVNSQGVFYGNSMEFVWQVVGALFIISWNVVATTLVCLVVRLVVPLRMPDDELAIGDDAMHGEKYDSTKHGCLYSIDDAHQNKAASGVTQNV